MVLDWMGWIGWDGLGWDEMSALAACGDEGVSEISFAPGRLPSTVVGGGWWVVGSRYAITGTESGFAFGRERVGWLVPGCLDASRGFGCCLKLRWVEDANLGGDGDGRGRARLSSVKSIYLLGDGAGGGFFV